MIPQPVDLNKLKGILGKSKQLMNVVETGNYTKGNVDSSSITQSSEMVDANQMAMMNNGNPPQQNVRATQSMQPTYRNMSTSKMPEAIKRAMMETPIPQMSTPNHTFSLDDVPDLVEKQIPTIQEMSKQRRNTNSNSNRNIVSEQYNSNDMREMIRDVVKEELIHYLSNEFTKTLSERIIKSTVQSLVREGKISVKKRT